MITVSIAALRHRLLRLRAFWLCGIAAVSAVRATPVEPKPIGTALQLLADRSLVAEQKGTAFRLGGPVEREAVLRSERPWEGNALLISSIYELGGTYYMLYRAEDGGRGREKASEIFLCLATSKDGLTWNKPELGLVAYAGSKANNITALEDGTPMTYVYTFLDPRPGTPENERVKAIDMREGERRAGGAGRGLRAQVLASADGKRWHELPLVADLQCDWPNAFDGGTIFWSEVEQQFVGYFRYWDVSAPRHAHTLDDWMIIRPGVRSVFRTASKDLTSWTKPEPMRFGDTPREHIYEAPTIPYYRNPALYIVLANRFNPGRRALTLAEEKQLGLSVIASENPNTPNYTFASDANDLVLLVTKPGSLDYDRPFMEAFLRPGPDLGNWSSRNNYPSLGGGIIPTGPAEISFYITRHHLQKDNFIQRISLRKDGFLSVNAPYAGGEMTTVPLTFTGDHLELNFSTSGAGEIRVEVDSLDGKPLPGFAFEDCDVLIGDRIGGIVSWHGRQSLSAYAGKPVRLRFRMMDADLYAFQFPTTPAQP